MTNQPQYEVPVHLVDLIVALRCEADRADREGFPGVRDRQNKLALHLENAEFFLQHHIPHPGYHLTATIQFSYQPNINASLLPEFRRMPEEVTNHD